MLKEDLQIRDRDRVSKQGIVEAGNADESELIEGFVSDDAELQMPPLKEVNSRQAKSKH